MLKGNTMSSNQNKTSAVGAMIVLAMACAISVSAQSSAQPSVHAPAAVNSLTAKSDPIREPGEADVTKTSVLPAAGADLATGPAEVPELSPRSEVSDPVKAHDGRSMTTRASNEARLATTTVSTATPQTAAADKWQFQFSPYFWLASLHGTGGVGNRTAQVDMSFGDIFSSLKFALMGVFEARKGRFVMLTDMEYVSIEDDTATPGPLFSNVKAGFKTFIFDPEVGYRLYDDPAKGASIDVLGGIRVWHVSTDLNFGAGILPATQIDGSRNWVDAIVGLRGKTAVSEKMFISGKFDLGGGGSKFSWQLFAGGGYNIKSNIALIAGYRVLDVNYNKNNFVYDMNQRGPIMGLGFKF